MFQHVWLSNFPAVYPRTHLVLRVRGRRTEIGVHTIRIRFVDDSGSELLGGEGTVQFGEPPAGVVDVEAGAVLVFDVPLPVPANTPSRSASTASWPIGWPSPPAIPSSNNQRGSEGRSVRTLPSNL